MKLVSLNTVALALVVLALVVPTGAVFSGDTLGGGGSIVLRPADGPNGEYAELSESGELEVDLQGAGLNPDATTVIDDVFTISNEGEEPKYVWLTHKAHNRVEFHTDRYGRIFGLFSRARVAPGQTLRVGIHVDGEEVPAGTTLLEELTIHARAVTNETQTPMPNATATPNGTVTTPTPVEPPTPTTPELGSDAEIEVTVEFENATIPDSMVNTSVLDDLPPDEADEDPIASIGAVSGGNETADLRYKGVDIDVLTRVNQSFSMTGTLSRFGSAGALGEQAIPLGVLDISVPPQYRESDARIRLRVPERRFNGSDPNLARVGRFVDGTWQVLRTEVAGREGDDVLLDAWTHGFSAFAIFKEVGVEFTWAPENRQPSDGPVLDVVYDEPGLSNVTLSVRDGRGRESSTTFRVLTNDQPRVDVEILEGGAAGEPTTLFANVTDQVGNVTVEWLLPDGTRTTGRQIRHTFAGGTQSIQVVVEDEFGERVEEQATVQIAGSGQGPVVDVIEFTLGVEGRIALIALLAAAALLVLRRFRGRSRSR